MTDDELRYSLGVDDSYRVVRVLADGASGRTELVTCGTSDLFVRKSIPSELANPEAWEVSREVSCPQVPVIRRTYWLPDAFVVVYDYVEGFSVAQMMRDQGKLGLQEATSIAVDVCAAAAELHQRSVIHRDITPGNVIVNAQGAHLIDLGIARRYDRGARHDTTRLGTFGFAAPEQFGFAQTDARSDVYSIGALLAFMLTGVLPSVPEFDSALEEVSPALRKVVEKACAFEPSARYASACELAQAVRAAVPAPAVSPTIQKAPQALLAALRNTHGGRRRAAILFVVVGALLVLLFVWVGVVLLMHPKSYSDPLSAILAFGIAAGVFDLCGFQPCLVVTHTRPYRDRGGRLGTYLRKCLRDTCLLAICFLFLVVLAVVLKSLTGA